MEQNYIRVYRKLRGIKTIAELAKLADIPESTLGEIERHKMRGNHKTLTKIAKALGITKEELYVSPKIKSFFFTIILCKQISFVVR